MNFSVLKQLVPFALAAAVLFAGGLPARAASFDGPWTVVIVTQSGNCDAAYSFPLRVSGGRVVSTGGAIFNGRISGGGGVSVAISSGGSSPAGPADGCRGRPAPGAGTAS